MAGSKLAERIALAAILAALVITVLFMHGEALGMQKIVPEGENALFTDNDLDADWYTGNAVTITLTGDGAVIDGDGAYVLDGDVVIYAAGRYVLTGTLDDGSIIINERSRTTGKVWILADGAEVYCSDSAALDIEEADKVFLTLAEGSENTFASGSEYSEEAVENNIRGAVFSRDDLSINGSGSLTVSSEYRHGIVCNDDLRITGSTIRITAAEDGIHANDSAVFGEMTLEISAGDDGITVSNDDNTGYLTVESGCIEISDCAEGLESRFITINGGDIRVSFTDDGINAGGETSGGGFMPGQPSGGEFTGGQPSGEELANGQASGGQPSGETQDSGETPFVLINGGTITLVSENGRDVDGIDSNGDVVINGGTVVVSVSAGGPNNAIDYGSENGGQCLINGGTVIAAGSSQMLEEISNDSAQGSVMYTFDSTQEAGQAIELRSTDGSTILQCMLPNNFSSLVLSAPGMETGSSYTLLVRETEYTVELTEMATAYGSTGFGGFGGPPGGFGGSGDFGGTEGFEKPEGFKKPEGFERPAGDFSGTDGFERPEGFGRPSGDFDGAEGFGPPGGFDDSGDDTGFSGMPAPPEGFENGMPSPPEGFEGGMPAPPEGFGGLMEGQQEEIGMSAEEMKTILYLVLASALVLLAGIAAAAKAGNRKNIA